MKDAAGQPVSMILTYSSNFRDMFQFMRAPVYRYPTSATKRTIAHISDFRSTIQSNQPHLNLLTHRDSDTATLKRITSGLGLLEGE